MSVLPHRLISSTPRLLSAVVVLALFSGCSTDTIPTSPAARQEPEGQVYLAFSPQIAQRAAKPPATRSAGDIESQTVVSQTAGLIASKVFHLWGGKLSVADLGGPGVTDDLQVTFSVPQGGLSQPTSITMTVYGNTAQDLVMVFDPAGLVFLKAAELEITLGDDRLDIPLSQIKAYHAYDDGTVVDARILSRTDREGTSELCIEVPSFSRYGLRDK